MVVQRLLLSWLFVPKWKVIESVGFLERRIINIVARWWDREDSVALFSGRM